MDITDNRKYLCKPGKSDGIFADNKEEFDVINSQFFNQNIIIVDASDIAEKWFKFIIETVSELTSHDCYLFLSLNFY